MAGQCKVVGGCHSGWACTYDCNLLACSRCCSWELRCSLGLLLCICNVPFHVADRHRLLNPCPAALILAWAGTDTAKTACKRCLLPYLVGSLKLLTFCNQSHEILYRDVGRAFRLAWRHTVAAVVGDQKVYAHLACLVNLAPFYCHNHSVAHLGGTGWYKVTFASLYLYCADKAAGERLEPLGIAQGRYVEAAFAGCLKYCCSCWNCNIYSVYFKIHFVHIR